MWNNGEESSVNSHDCWDDFNDGVMSGIIII